ncbi:MAG TPA: aspartyl-phosphate phosphatase Spo0E family protein [Bacillota bacterium]|nr:aspartyl-phosphate phosphatase Spo0E family protein [Bacillota bacterium]HOL09180.1 aspartyl-phosphate phosphatase Spo0E family protein [Bacillota bacterium]HPO96855.1 aspartyl-phosphate phosphatase Spo0E family protein [Bacillota bacterium]
MEQVIDKMRLKDQIKITRAKMNEIWNRLGYTDEEVLAVSIELDNLMNQYQQLFAQELIRPAN